MNGSNSVNSLDEVRINGGTENLNDYFEKLIHSDLNQAMTTINDKNLSFTSLFILKDKLKESNILSDLSIRNKIALNIVDEILDKENSHSTHHYSPSKYIQTTASTLKWMLETGAPDDGYNNEFDRALDITSILLTKVYKEKDILPIIRDMIFKRHKKGLLIHDLLWGFFESNDTESLFLIGEKLRSKDIKDVEFAIDILRFIPEIKSEFISNPEYLYLTFIHWFEENRQFLYYTGESFQQTSNPKPYDIDMKSKYLFKSISNKYQTLTLNETNMISDFNKLDDNTKSFLTNYSYRMRNEDIYKWNLWINLSIEEQLRIARTRNGVI